MAQAQSAGAPPLLAGYRTKTQLVYQALRRALLAGAYPPGSRVVADQVAGRFRVSKVPVREAIVRLAGEGWLEISPHVGAVVPRLSPQEVLETSLIRGALEAVAVREAAAELTDRDLEGLRALVRRMDRAAASRPADYPALNFRFHAAICARCPYPLLRDLAVSMAERSLRLRTVRFLPKYITESQRDHRRLVRVLERRDGRAAAAIAREHIENAGRLLSAFAAERAHAGSGKGRPAAMRPARASRGRDAS